MLSGAVGVKTGRLRKTTTRPMRTSSKNIDSRYCNHFVTISTFLIRQGCGSSAKMTLVERALILFCDVLVAVAVA